MTIKLKALQTFDGIEGFVKKGEVFEVASQERADKLNKLGFAEETDQDAPVNHEKPLSDYKVDELKQKAKDLGVEGYSNLLKDDLVSEIESRALSNVRDQSNVDGTQEGTPAQLQTLESGKDSGTGKSKAAPSDAKAEGKEK